MFLGSYVELFGERNGLLLVSAVFALFHTVLSPFMGVGTVVIFMVFLFFQAYAWGLIYRRTGSLWGATLAHTIADVLFVTAVFIG